MPDAPAIERKFWTALGLYAILAAVVWFTLGEGTTIVFGKPVAIRAIPLFVLGMFAFRTIVAREADKIRRSRLEGEQQDPGKL